MGFHQRWASAVLFVVSSALLVAAPAPRIQRYVWERYPGEVNSNSVSINFEAVGEVPEFVAVDVQGGDSMEEAWEERERALANFRAELKTNKNARLAPPPTGGVKTPHWLPFQTNLLINLGPGEGARQISFAYKYKGQPFDGGWSGSRITVKKGMPSLRIVNPTNLLSSQPMIQLQGLTSRDFDALRYDRFDNAGNKVGSDDQGLGSSFIGGYDFKNAENYFTFFDVELSPGTNTFVFHGKDAFGNEMTTNIVVVFSTAHDHAAPVINIRWPRPGTEVIGENYSIDGRMDDFTAKLEARIQTAQGSQTQEGLVERSGVFWIEHIPLVLGTNQITLTATDAAGNTAQTSFSILGRDGPIITIDPVNPPDLWNSSVAVTGRVVPAANDVWINGVQAQVKPDGTWSAQRVPVLSPNGGTAVFEMSAVPRNSTPLGSTKAGHMAAAQASLSTNAIVLNASTPACGIFRLHLSETLGKSFVIFTSTNLTDWAPMLTNLNAGASFDHTVDTAGDACRFFKVVPLP